MKNGTHEFDAELLERMLHDDRLALNTLFAIYYQNLCVFANTYLKNTQESEEVVSDVFFNLWRGRHNLTIEKSLKAYLFISVKNGALAVIRKRQPIFENIEEILFTTNLYDSYDPEQALSVKELQNRIDMAVEKLPARCKQIFFMSRMDSLSYKEISMILGIAEKTVENQIVKALQIIRQHIAPFKTWNKSSA